MYDMVVRYLCNLQNDPPIDSSTHLYMVITILLTVVHCYLHLCRNGAKGFELSLSPVLDSEANPSFPELLHI